MDDINDNEDQIIDLAKEIRSGIESMSKLRGDAKAEQVYVSYNTEIRYLSADEAKPYKQRSKEYNTTIMKLQADLNWAKADSDRSDLLGPGSGGPGVQIEDMGAKQMINTALDVQDDSIDSLKRSEKMVEHAKEIGIETSGTLQEQTAQIGRIDENVDKVEENLRRADKLLRMFLRRLMTDKVIALTVLMVVIIIIIVIVVKSIASPWVDIWSFNVGSFNFPWE